MDSVFFLFDLTWWLPSFSLCLWLELMPQCNLDSLKSDFSFYSVVHATPVSTAPTLCLLASTSFINPHSLNLWMMCGHVPMCSRQWLSISQKGPGMVFECREELYGLMDLSLDVWIAVWVPQYSIDEVNAAAISATPSLSHCGSSSCIL